MSWGALLLSKTFWAGVGLCALAVYQLTQGHADQAVQSVLGACVAWGLRHSIAKLPGGDPPAGPY